MKGSLTMNDNQKERLLKIAETNPELAKEMMDFMKEEKQSSKEPMTVKVISEPKEKIKITDRQKKDAKIFLSFLIMGFVFIVLMILFCGIPLTQGHEPSGSLFAIFMILGAASFIGANIYQVKTGLPSIKVLFNKHFQL